MMKKMITWLILCALILTTATAFAGANTYQQPVGTGYLDGKTSDKVYIRKEPNASSKVCGIYYSGTSCTYDYDQLGNEWMKVFPGGSGGYVLAENFSATPVASMQPIGTINSTSGKVNLRTSPDTASGSTMQLSHGTKVTVIGQPSNTWYYVDYNNGSVGFIMAKYLTVGNAASGTTITAIVNNKHATNRLNLRTSASTSAISLGKYYTGVSVTVLEVGKNGWNKVRIGTLQGYMQNTYLIRSEKSGSITPNMPTLTIPNGNGTLYLFEAQSTSSKCIDSSCIPGTQLQVLGVAEDFYHVRVNGKTGFMPATPIDPNGVYSFSNPTTSSASSATSKPTVTAAPSVPSTSASSSSTWTGPTGTHPIGEFTYPIDDYGAAINNPNPADRLNIRADKSETSKSLGKYYNGARVSIESPSDGVWTYVSIGTLFGYVKSIFLDINPSNPPASAMPIMTVSNPPPTRHLNLRQEPSTSSESLGQYANGTAVTVMGYSEKWAHVLVDGQMGFMMGIYLK